MELFQKSIEVGQYLQAGTPVCSAVDYTNLWVSANFKETQIEEMRPEQLVDIKIDAFSECTYTRQITKFRLEQQGLSFRYCLLIMQQKFRKKKSAKSSVKY